MADVERHTAEPAPLHPAAGLRPGAWYLCLHPDRPITPQVLADQLVAVDFDCPDCRRMAAAFQAKVGNVKVTERTRAGLELPGRMSLRAKLEDEHNR